MQLVMLRRVIALIDAEAAPTPTTLATVTEQGGQVRERVRLSPPFFFLSLVALRGPAGQGSMTTPPFDESEGLVDESEAVEIERRNTRLRGYQGGVT